MQDITEANERLTLTPNKISLRNLFKKFINMVIKHYFDGDFNINPMKLNDNKSLEMQGCSQQIWKPRALPIYTAWFYNEAFYFNVTHYIPR